MYRMIREDKQGLRALVLFACIAAFLVGCRGSGGSDLEQSAGEREGSAVGETGQQPTNDKKLHTHKETFQVNLESTEEVVQPVHMLWAVDNSESMAAKGGVKIRAVKKAIEAFAEGLQNHGDKVVVTMLASVDDEGGNGTSLDRGLLERAGIHIVPFNFNTYSYHKLQVLAKYLSPSNYRRYGFDLVENKHLGTYLSDHSVQRFFRSPDALKVIVVVTDNCELRVGGHGELASVPFLELIKEQYGRDLSSYRFFGFLDLLQSHYDNRDVFKVAACTYASYYELLDKLGGNIGIGWDISDLKREKGYEVLDIVEKKSVNGVLQRVLTLEHGIEKVLSVKVNGVALSSQDFYSAQKKLRIASADLKEGDSVEVLYQSTES